MTDARGVGRMLHIGYRTARGYDASGKLPKPIRLGGKVLWSIDELRNWIKAGCPDRATWERVRPA
jgi:predicted DNA-binding transcriptional regulator AlpA